MRSPGGRVLSTWPFNCRAPAVPSRVTNRKVALFSGWKVPVLGSKSIQQIAGGPVELRRLAVAEFVLDRVISGIVDLPGEGRDPG